MSGFHDISFPLRLARGAVGGPERRTDVIDLADGREARNTAYYGSRRRWEVGSAVRSLDDLSEIIAFFEARRGRLFGFRFRDPADHKSSKPSQTPTPEDQLIGTGDGQERTFQLSKTYSDHAGSFTRVITRPVEGSVRVSISGQESPSDSFIVDTQTGLITLATAPPDGAIVRAGFVFDTPARFDTDRLDVSIDAFEAGRIVSIGLVEVAP
jgi:uncharacterized protein (TIGR02217 family)